MRREELYRLWLGFFIITGLAAAIRVCGLSWGLPQEFHPDEPLVVPRAVKAVTTGDWNPHYFLVPSLQTGITSLAYKIIYLGGRITGVFENVDGFAEWAAWHNGTLYLVGRGISVVFGLLVVIGTMFLAEEVLRKNTSIPSRSIASRFVGSEGLIAGLYVSVSPLVTQSSRFITPDIPMLAFYTWSLWAILRASRLADIRMLILGAFLAGLAISSKYSATILLLPLIICGYLMKQSGEGKPAIIGFSIPAIGALVAGFLIGTPWALLDIATFLNHLQIQYTAQHEGHLGMERAGATIFRIFSDLILKEGAGLLLFGIAGVGILWRNNRRAWWILVPLLIIYILEISRWRTYADRYLLPALPLMGILAVMSWEAIISKIKSDSIRTIVSILLILFLVLPPAIINYHLTKDLFCQDTRTIALEWIEENIPPGTRILWEIGGPQPADRNAPHHREPSYDLITLPPWFSETAQGVDPLIALLEVKPEYVITTSNYRARYEDAWAEKRFPKVAEAWRKYYSELDSKWDTAYEVRPGKDAQGYKVTGPEIRIYSRRKEISE